MIIKLAIIFGIFLIGSFIQGVSGFGFGLFAMGFLPFLFTVKESTLLVISLSIMLAGMIAIRMYKHIQWSSLIYILGAMLVGRFVGFIMLSNYGESDILKGILGTFLILVVVYLLFSKHPKPGRKVNKTWLPLIVGFSGGVIGGMFAVGGPFFVFYYLLLFHDNKYAYSANLQVTFVLGSSLTVILHGFNGDFTIEFLGYFLVGLVSVFIGSRIGMHYFTRIPQEKIKKAAAIVVGFAAINLILFG